MFDQFWENNYITGIEILTILAIGILLFYIFDILNIFRKN